MSDPRPYTREDHTEVNARADRVIDALINQIAETQNEAVQALLPVILVRRLALWLARAGNTPETAATMNPLFRTLHEALDHGRAEGEKMGPPPIAALLALALGEVDGEA